MKANCGAAEVTNGVDQNRPCTLELINWTSGLNFICSGTCRVYGRCVWGALFWEGWTSDQRTVLIHGARLHWCNLGFLRPLVLPAPTPPSTKFHAKAGFKYWLILGLIVVKQRWRNGILVTERGVIRAAPAVGSSTSQDEEQGLALATTIQYQRYGLVCKGNLSFESCVDGKF